MPEKNDKIVPSVNDLKSPEMKSPEMKTSDSLDIIIKNDNEKKNNEEKKEIEQEKKLELEIKHEKKQKYLSNYGQKFIDFIKFGFSFDTPKKTKKFLDDEEKKSKFEKYSGLVLLACVCVIILILYFLFVDYSEISHAQMNISDFYKMYMDVAIMIFFGFAYLYSFLKKYSYSGIGYSYFFCSFMCFNNTII
eukprot:EC824116.1.p1 GENE.EC824116.1~~EC824116.1.p1  ORF type:complete len:216 (+),score=67.32 EC824116.1:75-650(+)